MPLHKDPNSGRSIRAAGLDRAEVRNLKTTAPHIFHEYQRLKIAERRLAEARVELEDAQRAWNALGEAK